MKPQTQLLLQSHRRESALDPLSRRDFVKLSALAASLTLNPVILPLRAAEPPESGHPARPLKVVCIGGHPDDPESGCAGTLARYSELGHTVTVIYLTRGERGIRGKANEEAARIRSEECEAACNAVGAKAVFAGQIDGSTELNQTRVQEIAKLLAREGPDVLFTHWPIDTHMDHQVASILAIRSYLTLPRVPQLYFFEVNTGSQSLGFTPNVYVDISAVLEKKKAALFSHQSQDGQAIWRQHHEPVAIFRGREAGVKAAEAFYHLNRQPETHTLPGV